MNISIKKVIIRYQDGIEYQINARGGDGSLGNNYPGESELYLVRVEVKWDRSQAAGLGSADIYPYKRLI